LSKLFREIFKYKGIYIALIPRAGSTAIRWSIEPHTYFDQTDQPVHAFIRDPIDRFISAAKLAGKYRKVPKRHPYELFVDRVLDGEKDQHWIPQAEYLKGLNIIPHPLERMNSIWAKWRDELGFPRLKPDNCSPMFEHRLSVINTSYRINDLVEYYKEDYRLRHG